METGQGVPSRLKGYVWSSAEQRPTMPIRLVLAIALFVVVVTVVQVAAVVVLVPTESVSDTAVTLVGGLSLQVALLVGTLAAAVLLDRRRLSDLGLAVDRDWLVDLGFGLLLGAVLMTGIFLVALAAGLVRVTGTFVTDPDALTPTFASGFLLITLFFVLVGVAEELLARGWLLTNVAEGAAGLGPIDRRWGVVVGIVVSSLLFGLLHASNPGASTASTAGITLAGVMLAAGFVLTGDLAIPVGLHITWNLFQGPVFGFPVSGMDFGVRAVDTAEQGPDLVTGGQFGPEAGLLGIAAVVVGTGLTVLYVRYRYGDARLDREVATPELRWRTASTDTAGSGAADDG